MLDKAGIDIFNEYEEKVKSLSWNYLLCALFLTIATLINYCSMCFPAGKDSSKVKACIFWVVDITYVWLMVGVLVYIGYIAWGSL
jgi:hypothetical protein